MPTAADSSTADTAVSDSDPPATTDEDVDFCTTLPDPAAIEQAIGVAVKEPSSVGDSAFFANCTYLDATNDFPGITFSVKRGRTMAAQIDFAKENFKIDIVEIAGSNGLFKGEGNSVYFESDGTLYQTSATIDGDSLQASINLMKVWRKLP